MIFDLDKDSVVSAHERIALYGDGCFTTIAVRNGVPCLLAQHIARLQKSASRLGIKFADWNNLSMHLAHRAKELELQVLKVVVSRGEGGRGYATDSVVHPKAFVYQSAFPEHYQRWFQQGISLNISPIQLSRQPLLAGIKHLNRLEQVMVKQAMQSESVDDCVVCDTQGYVVETSASNLFWRKGEHWYTPSLAQCGVEGVMRNRVISILNSMNIMIKEVSVTAEELFRVDELFICNSLMECIPVVSLKCQGKFQNWDRHNLQVDTLMTHIGSKL